MLSRVFYIVLDFIHVQEDYTSLQAKTAKASGNAGESDELRKRIRELEAELGKSKSSDRDFGECFCILGLFICLSCHSSLVPYLIVGSYGPCLPLSFDRVFRVIVPADHPLTAETLKKQAAQQNQEYNRLADAHNKAVSSGLFASTWSGADDPDWLCIRQKGRLDNDGAA